VSYQAAAVAALALMLPAAASAQESAAQADGLSMQNAVASQTSMNQINEPQAPPLEETIGNSVAMAAANAVYAQQQANVTYQAASTVAVAEQETPAAITEPAE
jgi:hypothetical protein